MNLYLVRHGEALSADINPERPLSDTGIANVKKMAESLKRSGVSVDTVFYSTKKRAEETALILMETLNPECNLVEKSGLEPNDPVETIFGEIIVVDGNLMIVGHLPFLRDLAEMLLTGSKSGELSSFKPGSVLSLAGSGTKWDITGFTSPDSI